MSIPDGNSDQYTLISKQCDRCGTLITDTVLHNRWHDEQRATALVKEIANTPTEIIAGIQKWLSYRRVFEPSNTINRLLVELQWSAETGRYPWERERL